MHYWKICLQCSTLKEKDLMITWIDTLRVFGKIQHLFKIKAISRWEIKGKFLSKIRDIVVLMGRLAHSVSWSSWYLGLQSFWSWPTIRNAFNVYVFTLSLSTYKYTRTCARTHTHTCHCANIKCTYTNPDDTAYYTQPCGTASCS